jgi:hypothetical protein
MWERWLVGGIAFVILLVIIVRKLRSANAKIDAAVKAEAPEWSVEEARKLIALLDGWAASKLDEQEQVDQLRAMYIMEKLPPGISWESIAPDKVRALAEQIVLRSSDARQEAEYALSLLHQWREEGLSEDEQMERLHSSYVMSVPPPGVDVVWTTAWMREYFQGVLAKT